MNPQQITAWITIAQVLANLGLNVSDRIKGLIHHAHPELTPDQVNTAFAAIIEDDAVRAALAEAASRPRVENP